MRLRARSREKGIYIERNRNYGCPAFRLKEAYISAECRHQKYKWCDLAILLTYPVRKGPSFLSSYVYYKLPTNLLLDGRQRIFDTPF